MNVSKRSKIVLSFVFVLLLVVSLLAAYFIRKNSTDPRGGASSAVEADWDLQTPNVTSIQPSSNFTLQVSAVGVADYNALTLNLGFTNATYVSSSLGEGWQGIESNPIKVNGNTVSFTGALFGSVANGSKVVMNVVFKAPASGTITFNANGSIVFVDDPGTSENETREVAASRSKEYSVSGSSVTPTPGNASARIDMVYDGATSGAASQYEIPANKEFGVTVYVDVDSLSNIDDEYNAVSVTLGLSNLTYVSGSIAPAPTGGVAWTGIGSPAIKYENNTVTFVGATLGGVMKNTNDILKLRLKSGTTPGEASITSNGKIVFTKVNGVSTTKEVTSPENRLQFTIQDTAPTSTPGGQCPKKPQGDADCDGRITINDVRIFRNEYQAFTAGTLDVTKAQANFDTSGEVAGDTSTIKIDIRDYRALRNGWILNNGSASTPTPVPTATPTGMANDNRTGSLSIQYSGDPNNVAANQNITLTISANGSADYNAVSINVPFTNLSYVSGKVVDGSGWTGINDPVVKQTGNTLSFTGAQLGKTANGTKPVIELVFKAPSSAGSSKVEVNGQIVFVTTASLPSKQIDVTGEPLNLTVK